MIFPFFFEAIKKRQSTVSHGGKETKESKETERRFGYYAKVVDKTIFFKQTSFQLDENRRA